MGESGRHEELLAPVGAHSEMKTLTTGRRAPPQIHNGVENLSAQDLYELCLRMRWCLEMQTPRYVGRGGECLLVLRPIYGRQTSFNTVALLETPVPGCRLNCCFIGLGTVPTVTGNAHPPALSKYGFLFNSLARITRRKPK